MGRLTRRTRVTRVAADGQATTRADTVIVEEPLEIRLGGDATLVTMRTPGHDIELLHGLLLAEGVIRSAEDVITAAYCAGSVATGELGLPENTYNLLDVTLRDPAAGARLSRATLTSASCGVCGKASIDELATRTAWPVAADPLLMRTASCSWRARTSDATTLSTRSSVSECWRARSRQPARC